MVCINTNIYQETPNIKFTHFVAVPRCDCVIGTAREEDSNKTKLYLIFNDRGRIYQRNGLADTWVELHQEHKQSIRQSVRVAIQNENVPCFSN